MFLENLAASLINLCSSRKLTFEAASDQCRLGAEYFGDIASGKAAPTVMTLENLCTGFDLTPNDLLVTQAMRRELAFREPMPVIHIRVFHSSRGPSTYPVCPQCGMTFEREYQSYCDRCGQCLSWKEFSNATILLPKL